MLVTMMKSKIHRATITEAVLEYEGSITIDRDLLDKANMFENEKVQVLNMNNGSRLETYIIDGERGSGIVCLNGPAARLGYPGDEVVVIAYGIMPEEEAKKHEPLIVKVDKKNRIKKSN
ncbi:MAG TPA: aspartate 1-decarboxylase [Spirochaetota bacterium]|nr:MAG: Aspartate 1-decarboxylase precursor [Spirochaetes bacterium ADurb.Bin133]HNZ26239.1 aspartate 1-decarboxylase [Spirochaetota bacterium]HPY87411.1 aspartate 1-decarboxylase [Spirochaetota bacterium]HQB61457.1 aspartate 1-decarboxylase [Spirochaetota bacterium]